MTVVETLFQAQGNCKIAVSKILWTPPQTLDPLFWTSSGFVSLTTISFSQAMMNPHLVMFMVEIMSFIHLYPGCSLFSSTCWILETFFLIILFSLTLIIVVGNLLTMVTLAIEQKKTLYQFLQVKQNYAVWFFLYFQFQINLCIADILLAISGPLTTAIVTILLLSQALTEADFMDPDLFSKFQHPREASSVGFKNVLKTDKLWLVVSGVGVSLSTTVSIITISSMAMLR